MVAKDISSKPVHKRRITGTEINSGEVAVPCHTRQIWHAQQRPLVVTASTNTKRATILHSHINFSTLKQKQIFSIKNKFRVAWW